MTINTDDDDEETTALMCLTVPDAYDDDNYNHIRTAAPTTSNGASDSEAIEIDGKDCVQPLHCVRGDSTVKP